ncbi:MAG: hypothetical protein M3O78_07770 [Chloroflexota bacterium]|nr:hypothetical protein [Chloroflexota bacterium]
MTTRKASTSTSYRPARAIPRGRSHSLAPEHLGELASGAVLAIAIGGLALLLAAGSMMVNGLTIGARYTGTTPPPSLGQLGMGQLVGGIGLAVLSIGLVASSLALLADMRFGRLLTILFSAVASLLAAAGAILLVGAAHRDNMLDAGLGVAFVVFGGAAVIIARSRG